MRRFDAPDLARLRVERADAEEARELALAGVLRTLTVAFCAEWPRWRAAAEAAAALDALSSLAVAAEELAATCADTCTPEVRESTGFEGESPFFRADRLRHPCVGSLAAGNAFVPNDVRLGGAADRRTGEGVEGVEGVEPNTSKSRSPPLTLLTGPNMGGKSTLLRQVCLAAVMAHVGADVPARSLAMSACDAVYVRMGARDDVAGGRSTFMVELAETASMLRRCTKDSLVALDELGRGTSTSDGFAIASAVVDALARVGARTLFATHYHRLAEEHERGDDEARLAETRRDKDEDEDETTKTLSKTMRAETVALAHMGCDVRRAGRRNLERLRRACHVPVHAGERLVPEELRRERRAAGGSARQRAARRGEESAALEAEALARRRRGGAERVTRAAKTPLTRGTSARSPRRGARRRKGRGERGERAKTTCTRVHEDASPRRRLNEIRRVED